MDISIPFTTFIGALNKKSLMEENVRAAVAHKLPWMILEYETICNVMNVNECKSQELFKRSGTRWVNLLNNYSTLDLRSEV